MFHLEHEGVFKDTKQVRLLAKRSNQISRKIPPYTTHKWKGVVIVPMQMSSSLIFRHVWYDAAIAALRTISVHF